VSTDRFILEIVGLTGLLTGIWSALLLARLRASGWWIRFASHLLWLTYGLATLSLANAISSVVYIPITLYGIRKWRRAGVR
jgi:hypothetical protein